MTSTEQEQVIEEVQDHKEVLIHDGVCSHYLVESKDQDTNSELLQVQCTKCPYGCSINDKEFYISEGKICPLKK